MTTATTTQVPPRRIQVNGRPIRLRWLQQLIWLFIAANAGAYIISALYYLIVQVDWHVGSHTYLNLKPDWDHLFSFQGWPADRHDIRDIYEAVLATLFVRSLLADWRKHDRRAPAWYVLISPVLIIVAAFPVVILGILLLNYGLPDVWHFFLSHRALHNPVHFSHQWSWAGTYLSTYPWQRLLIGVMAGLVVHRVYAPAGNTVQLHFVGRAVDKARDAAAAGDPNPQRYLPRWPWPPVIRERAAWIMQSDQPVPDRTRNITAAVRIVTGILTALAIYGAYIRFVVAKGQGH